MTLKEIMQEKRFKELNKTLGTSVFYGCKFFELTENIIITDYDIKTQEPTAKDIFLVFDYRRYTYISKCLLTDVDKEMLIDIIIRSLYQ